MGRHRLAKREVAMAQNAAARSCPYSHAPTDFDPFDLTDPFPFYEWARQQDPVFFSSALNYYVVTRYDDIKAIFDDWKTFSSENAQAPVRPMGEAGKKILKDGGFTTYSGLSARVPPDHTRIRKLVQGCFGPRRFNAIEPQIRSIVNRAIDGLPARVKWISSLNLPTTCPRWFSSNWSAFRMRMSQRSRIGRSAVRC